MSSQTVPVRCESTLVCHQRNFQCPAFLYLHWLCQCPPVGTLLTFWGQDEEIAIHLIRNEFVASNHLVVKDEKTLA